MKTLWIVALALASAPLRAEQPPASMQQYFDAGTAARKQKDFSAAEKLYKEALQLSLGNDSTDSLYRAYFYLALSMSRRKQTPQ